MLGLPILNAVNKGSERYLIIEQSGDGFETTVVRVNTKEGEMKILKRFKVAELKELKRNLYAKFDKVVLAFDSSGATTIKDSFKVKTLSRREVITDHELEDLTFKALWEFLNKYRSWAAKKLNVSDASLVLNDIQVTAVRLDSHNLFNPVGFKGGELEFILKGTFIARQLYHDASEIRKIGKISIIERVAAIASFLNRDKSFLADVRDDRTDVFYRADDSERFVEEVNWGVRNLKGRVSEEFGVDYDTAERLIEIYSKGLVSEAIGRRFTRILSDELGVLVKKVNGNKRNFVFYFGSLVLPDDILSKRTKGGFFRLDEELSRKNLKLSISRKTRFDILKNQGTIALITHSYVDPRYDFLNAMLRRRAGWIVSNF